MLALGLGVGFVTALVVDLFFFGGSEEREDAVGAKSEAARVEDRALFGFRASSLDVEGCLLSGLEMVAAFPFATEGEGSLLALFGSSSLSLTALCPVVIGVVAGAVLRLLAAAGCCCVLTANGRSSSESTNSMWTRLDKVDRAFGVDWEAELVEALLAALDVDDATDEARSREAGGCCGDLSLRERRPGLNRARNPSWPAQKALRTSGALQVEVVRVVGRSNRDTSRSVASDTYELRFSSGSCDGSSQRKPFHLELIKQYEPTQVLSFGSS